MHQSHCCSCCPEPKEDEGASQGCLSTDEASGECEGTVAWRDEEVSWNV